MNLVGKIFVVLILIMSVVFMSFAMAVYSTHRNWRESAMQLKEQVGDSKAQNERLTTELEQLKTQMDTEQKALERQLSKLETARQELLQQRDQDQERLALAVGQNRELTGAVGATQQQLTETVQEVSRLRQDIIEAQQDRDESFSSVVDTTEKLHAAHAQLVAAKERENQLVKDTARFSRILDENNLDPDASPEGRPPVVNGDVTEVTKSNLIEVSIGSDDGLKPGHTVEVFRGRSYLGRAEVLETSPDRSVARILKSYRRGQIRKGDRVATRLKIS